MLYGKNIVRKLVDFHTFILSCAFRAQAVDFSKLFQDFCINCFVHERFNVQGGFAGRDLSCKCVNGREGKFHLF